MIMIYAGAPSSLGLVGGWRIAMFQDSGMYSKHHTTRCGPQHDWGMNILTETKGASTKGLSGSTRHLKNHFEDKVLRH